jgi:hypothetical protein
MRRIAHLTLCYLVRQAAIFRAICHGSTPPRFFRVLWRRFSILEKFFTFESGRIYPEPVRRASLTLASLCFGTASLFFAWYTFRLIWVNLMAPDAAQHRQTGMYIGAVAFPFASLLFGYLSRRCRVKARRDLPE